MQMQHKLLVSYSLAHSFAWYRVAKVGTRSINKIFEKNIRDYVYLDCAQTPNDLELMLQTGCFRFAFVRTCRVPRRRTFVAGFGLSNTRTPSALLEISSPWRHLSLYRKSLGDTFLLIYNKLS